MRGMKFSDIEIKDLLKSLMAIGLAFTIAQAGLNISFDFLLVLFISIFTVGTGFILHELAHKYFAQKYGCWSEFRADDRMLVMAVLVSFLGVVFAAPGAVMISGHLNRRQYGIVSSAGVVTNLLLAMVFFVLALGSPLGLIKTSGQMGFMINTWLALFNMIPFGPFDGRKVLSWNRTIYGVIVAVGILFMFLGGLF